MARCRNPAGYLRRARDRASEYPAAARPNIQGTSSDDTTEAQHRSDPALVIGRLALGVGLGSSSFPAATATPERPSGDPSSATSPAVRPLIDWMFRDRRTGRLTVAQFPNASLGAFLAATALRWLVAPDGGVRTAIDLIAGVALVIWASDEMARGVNPFRRVLGASALAIVIVRLLG